MADHMSYNPWPTGAPGAPTEKVLTVQGLGPGGEATPVNTSDLTYATLAHGYAQVTVTNSARSLSALGVTIPDWATMAFIMPEDGMIRYRCDGVAPTSSLGWLVWQSQPWPIQSASSLAGLSLISTTNSGVTLSIEFRG
jgi:hypothetical protein